MQLSHLLMIEDDARLAVMVGEYLERSGYSFEHAAEGGEGLRRVQQRLPDLVILDLMLPDADGLEMGADDYLPKPFFRLPGSSERDGGVGLGLARVRAIARLHGGEVTCRDRTGGGAVFVVSLQSVVA